MQVALGAGIPGSTKLQELSCFGGFPGYWEQLWELGKYRGEKGSPEVRGD